MKMKKIFVVLCLLPLSFVASAQSVTMSPYSRYGLGTLAEQSQGFNRGMNGLAQGFRLIPLLIPLRWFSISEWQVTLRIIRRAT